MDEVKYKFNNNIALSDNDKAALSFACGILVGMDYFHLGLLHIPGNMFTIKRACIVSGQIKVFTRILMKHG